MIDPVSQNPVPPGAMPSEVRDDVDIKASEGEFVVPADVVRFLGLEKLEGLVNKAKESLAQMAQNGRIGGKPAPEQAPREKPAAPLPQSMPAQPMGGPSRPPGMAEGGVVAQPATGSPAPSMQAYEGPDGRMVYIPFVNGQPLTPIPAGYRPASGVRQALQPNRPQGGGGSDFFNAAGGMRANTPRSPQEWSVDEFINYGQQLQSGVPDALMRGVGAFLPFSNILFGLAERNMQNTVPGLIDQMIETGMDANGNPLTDEQREGLLNTRNVMGERMAQERGDRFNPFESLSNLVGRLIGGNNNPSGQRQQNSMSNPSSGQSRSAVAPSQPPSSGSTPSASVSGQMTVAPDKEEKDAGTKSFAYGGLVSSQPKKGFIEKYGDPTAIKKQPIIGGAPVGTGFKPRNKKQPIIGG